MKERMKIIRKNKKMTQSEFGEALGLKGNTITSYETGLRTPSEIVINMICEKFNVNKEWLETGRGEIFNELTRDEQIADFVASVYEDDEGSFKRRLITTLASLNVEEWELLADIAERFLALKKED